MSQTEYMDITSSKITLSKKRISYDKLLPLLKEKFGEIPFNGKDTFMNVFVETNRDDLERYSKLTNLLSTVIIKIVQNYFHDKRIRDIYQLDVEFEKILKLAEPIPYTIGMYRPDFIFEKNGNEKICEIGCRYPINGWMVSHYIQLIFEELIHSEEKTSNAIPKKDSFITSVSEDFQKDKTIFCLHKKEKGTEVFSFFEELKNLGFTVANAAPDQLELINGQLEIEGTIARQFILEMDREELKDFNPEILKSLIETGKCLNDVRTLILVHDKRILSILYDAQIMKDYVNEEDYNFLKLFLIPSFSLCSEKKRNEILASSSNWILKRNSGGRGIDMHVKKECSPEIWENLIQNEWQNYMIQEFVEQDYFDLERENSIEKINLVGILLCYDSKLFGLGIFRGSTDSIVNVNKGSYILAPVAKSLEE
jgi:hypothetical protein